MLTTMKKIILITIIFNLNANANNGINKLEPTLTQIGPEYEVIADSNGTYTIENVISNKYKWQVLLDNDKITKPNITYWLKTTIYNETQKDAILVANQFYSIDLYVLDSLGAKKTNSFIPSSDYFSKELYHTGHNFHIPFKPSQEYIIKIKTNVSTGLGITIYTISEYANYLLLNNTFSTVFFTIVAIMFILNTLLFFKIKERIYLYYSLYLIFVFIYAIVSRGYFLIFFKINGIAFWHYSIPYTLSIVFLTLYIIHFIHAKENFPFIYKFLHYIILLRILGLLLSIFVIDLGKSNVILDIISILPLLYSIAKSAMSGFRPAWILFISLCIIFTALIINALGYTHLIFIMKGSTFEFVKNWYFFFTMLEILLFSYSLSDRFLDMKKNSDKIQLQTIEYQKEIIDKEKENSQLKDKVNSELELLVTERTKELSLANKQLKVQSEEISSMNEILKLDNEKLTQDVELLQKARVLATNLSYLEFCKTFENETAALRFIGDYKWKNGYKCKKCGYKSSYFIPEYQSRKCKVCNYNESPTVHTILDNHKFSPQKALYIVYATYCFQKINVTKLADELELRRATCHTFHKEVSDFKAKITKNTTIEEGWTSLLNHYVH